MPLQQSKLPRELQVIRLWASSKTSAQAIAAEQARKHTLAERFNREIPREDRKPPSSLLQKLAAAQKQQKLTGTKQPSQTSVRRMAAILKALDANKGTGKPLSEIFKRRN